MIDEAWLANAQDLISGEPDAEDCERFSSRYGLELIKSARASLATATQLATLTAECDALKEERDRLNAELDKAWASNASLESRIYVPGLLRCAKCKMRLISSTLNANDGSVRANNDPQACPNGCGPLWRVTERDAGNEVCDRLDAETSARQAAEASLGKAVEALPVIDELICTIDQYHKIGPDWTHKDGTECFEVSVLLDREDGLRRVAQTLTAIREPKT